MAATRSQIADWVAAYERLWRTAGTDGLGELFTEDATYLAAPFQDPHKGLAAIAELWEDEREGPDEVFEVQSEIVAVEGDTGVVRLEVTYGEPAQQVYLDLWIIRLGEDGRCRHFEEWPFWPGRPHVASG